MPIELDSSVESIGIHMPWHLKMAQAVSRHLALKSIGTTLFISLFFFAYFYVLKNPAYPVTVMPISVVDRIFSFQPLALSLYLSLWVYVSLPPALFTTQRDLMGYAKSMGATCLVALTIFYYWPTAAPAPDINWALYPSVSFLKNLDASGNAFPSLHVATAIFSGVWLHHLLRRFDSPAWLHLLNWTWCVGIIYSTLAIRQHVAVDVWGGLALGGVASWLSLVRRRPAIPGSKINGHSF